MMEDTWRKKYLEQIKQIWLHLLSRYSMFWKQLECIVANMFILITKGHVSSGKFYIFYMPDHNVIPISLATRKSYKKFIRIFKQQFWYDGWQILVIFTC